MSAPAFLADLPRVGRGLQSRWRAATLALLLAVSVAPGPALAQTGANPLQALHEQTLAQAQAEYKAAPDAQRRALAAVQEVAALNSLGRSAQALQRLDEAAAALGVPVGDATLRVKVLLPLGRCEEALPAVKARVEALDAGARQLLGPAHAPGGLLLLGAEPLLALTWCHAASQRYDEATATLARVADPFDPSLLHYRAAWYEALRLLGAAERPSLDVAARQLPPRAGHHDLGLAVVQGRMTLPQALAALERRRLAPAQAQDARAEMLFFAAVRAGAPAERAELLAQLEALAPYGSTEWVMARLLWAPR